MVPGRNSRSAIEFRKIWTHISVPLSLQFQILCQQSEKLYSSHPSPPQTFHFVFVCEKNISSWLSPMTWQEAGQWAKWLKMKKKFGKTFNKLTGGFWCAPKGETLTRWASASHSSRNSDIKSQTRAPRAVRWGHSWPHGWNLAKKTLWRYPFWGPNRSSPEAEANTDKKHSGKATAHGTGMIKHLISPTDYRLQAIFS